jgi:hypothetical protein
VSAALVIFAILTLARFVLTAAVTVVALVTKDAARRATAVSILPVLRAVPAVRQGKGGAPESE